MPQVVVTIDGKTYRMACDEGQEEHLLGLASQIDGRVAELRGGFGEIGDQRLTVMAAIMTADELDVARRRILELEAQIDALEDRQASAARNIASGREVMVETMNGMSEAIERIAGKLERRS